MRGGKKLVRNVTIVGLAVVIALQFVPPEFPRDNPMSDALIDAPPEVVEILRVSCFDCHTNETDWPFYAYVAPSSWLVTADVAGGRARMNLSDWNTMRVGFQKRFSRNIVERIEAGEMPLWQYKLAHWDASISDEELAVLRAWRDELNAPTN